MPKPDYDTMMHLIRTHFGTELQKAVTFERWKDGIEIDYPCYAIEAFYEGVEAITTWKACAILCPHCSARVPFVIAEGWMPNMFHDWKDGGPGGRVKCAAFDLRKSLQPIT